jgi:hypothetical protein
MNGESRLAAAPASHTTEPSTPPGQQCDEGAAAEVRWLIALADGFEAGLRASGNASDDELIFPRLARVVARRTLRLATDLGFARSARLAMQEQVRRAVLRLVVELQDEIRAAGREIEREQARQARAELDAERKRGKASPT